MAAFFHAFAYQPLYNILVLFYKIVPDFGVAIILLTLLVRFALVPVYKKQLETQKKMQELQPKIKAIQERYKHDKEQQTKELMEFYKQHKANPFAGCLPMVVQFFFLIGIFRVLSNIAGQNGLVSASDLYPFIASPEKINTYFLGFINLASTNSLHMATFLGDIFAIIINSPAHFLLAALSAAAQYFQTKKMMLQMQPQQQKKSSEEPDMTQIMNKQMIVIGPLLTLIIGMQFPAGLSLYWLTGTIFMLVQQISIEKKSPRGL